MQNICGALRDLVPCAKSLAKACNFTKSNTPPWVFFTFFKLYEWYQIAQSTTYLVHYDALLQNATAISLQNTTNVYYKMRQVFCYKMRQFH